MTTLRLPPDEFELVRKCASLLRIYDVPRWPTPDELREYLTGNVTIVKPGETLVVRVSDLTPSQVHEYQDALNRNFEQGFIPFRALVVYGDALGVVSASAGHDA